MRNRDALNDPSVTDPLSVSGPGVSWRPWSVGASVGFTLAGIALYFLAQAAVVLLVFIAAAILEAVGWSGTPSADLVATRQGFLVALSVILTAPAFSAGVVLLARMRGPVRDYLALRWTGWKQVTGWALAVAAFLYAFDSLGAWLGRPPVPDFMLDVYTTAGPRIWLWVALVLMAPLFEELLFRGFLIPGLESRWGGRAAVGISGLLFAVIHFQYDLFDMTGVLGLGLLFGAARVTSGSTLLPMVLHAGVNLAATVQAHWLVGG